MNTFSLTAFAIVAIFLIGWLLARSFKSKFVTKTPYGAPLYIRRLEKNKI